MDTQQQREVARYLAMELVFEHEGWNEIVRELENEIEIIKGQILAATDWDTVKFLQGKAAHCAQMIYLSDAVANVKEQLIAGDANADV